MNPGTGMPLTSDVTLGKSFILSLPLLLIRRVGTMTVPASEHHRGDSVGLWAVGDLAPSQELG